VWPLAQLADVCGEARRLGLSLHLDGARVLNAAVALGAPAAEIGRRFDTVGLCLSKGLGCPLGAVLATTTALEPRARRLKHMFGGAMRQAGIVAAAGLYALEHHVERLADDHANACRLADRLAAAGLPVSRERVETNFVVLDAARLGLSADDAIAMLRRRGVGASRTTRPGHVRLVTHLGISAEDTDAASAAAIAALG
jgi:threonine aldolase